MGFQTDFLLINIELLHIKNNLLLETVGVKTFFTKKRNHIVFQALSDPRNPSGIKIFYFFKTLFNYFTAITQHFTKYFSFIEPEVLTFSDRFCQQTFDLCPHFLSGFLPDVSLNDVG